MTRRLALVLALSMAAGGAIAQPLPPREIPDALKPWVSWVLDEVPDRVCPAAGTQAVCLWPGRLRLDLGAGGGTFALEAHADRPIALRLPGDARRWPQEVRLDGKPAAVVEQDGGPVTRLPAGGHRIEGRFEWRRLPDALPVSARIALVDLTVEGRRVPLPQRDEAGLLWLRRDAPQAGASGESLRIQVFRKLRDGIPLQIETVLDLEVSGKAREVELASALVVGSLPVAVSGGLPARLEKEGRLRVQVRAGRYAVTVLALVPKDARSLAAPASAPPWPPREVWVFEADESLRQVQVSGGTPVDPSRTDLPEAWRRLPAWGLESQASLSLQELRRGEPQAPPDRIGLERQIWLDLDGAGFTVRDTLSGTLGRTWRLDLQPPGVLGRAAVGGKDQLVTSDPQGGAAGVELRRGALALSADWRLPRQLSLPAVGWSASVEQLRATLHLPPGWRLLATTGVDGPTDSWLGRWTLLGFFLVLVVAFGTARLLDWRAGLLALAAVFLSYHERGAPLLSWLSLLGALGLLKVAPRGLLQRLGTFWRWASLLVLALVLVPFSIRQIRDALVPQAASQAPAGLEFAGAASDKVLGGAEERQVQEGAPAGPLPAAPPAEKEKKSLDAPSRRNARQEYSYGKALEQDPRAVLQTGPGVPSWTWQAHRLTWSGPVDKEHRLRLFLLSPLASLVLTIARLGLLLLLAARLAGFDRPLPEPRPPAVALAASVLLALAAVPARADEPTTPDAGLLQELKRRLTRPEPCAPQCVTTARMTVQVKGDQVAFTAEVHAAALGSWAVPGPVATWVPAEIRVDGDLGAAVVRLEDGFLRVRLDPGVHRIEVRGPAPAQDSVTLQLRDRPKLATADAPGWDLAGLRDDGPPDESLQLTRRLGVAGAPVAAATYSPWLEVTRRLAIGVSWRVTTEVRRVSPPGTPLSLKVPLLPGEALTEGDFESKGGEVVVSLARDQIQAQWVSTLEPAGSLELKAPQGRPWSEVWRVECSVVWECSLAETLAPTRRQSNGLFEPELRPWPGESATLRFLRPAGAAGQTLTIDEARLESNPGSRLETASLRLAVRSSREEPLTLRLPPGAEVQELKVSGVARPARAEAGRLSVSVPTGASTVELRWQEGHGLTPLYTAPVVGLSTPAVNVVVQTRLPEDRWLLRTPGPAWGPAVLFWGHLAYVLLAAWVLARLPGSPLPLRDWLLLGLGLAQVPVPAGFVVAGFLFALSWRQRRPLARAVWHDALQLVLVFWALAALVCLYGVVQTGLLLRPDMQVAGNGSSATELRWYLDRAADVTPMAGVWSLPLWIYRGAMLAWALWLAASLLRWAGWSWRCFSEGGLWRPLLRREAPEPPPPAPPDPGAE